jgi:signal transduction histidine kinase
MASVPPKRTRTRPKGQSRRSHEQALIAITDVILHHVQMEDLIPNLIETLQRVMQVDNVAILRLDPTGQVLVMDTVRGPEEVVADQVRVPVGQGVAGRIAASGQPLIIPDLSHAEVVNSFLSKHLSSLLGVPLRVADQILGVIHVSTIKRHVFTQDDVRLLQLVADRIALALERVTMIEQAQQSKVLAAEAMTNRMQTFLDITGHELRTPITVIKANVQLAQRAIQMGKAGDLPEPITQRLERAVAWLESADKRIDQANRLINDLFDTTRIQAGKLAVQRSTQDFVGLVREVIELHQTNWPDRAIVIEIPDRPLVLRCDPDRISQVLMNLITNALKYSPVDSLVRIQVQLEPEGVRVAVIDQGPGLTAQQQELLFEAFVQAEGIQSQSEAAGGVGLGLFISKAIVTQHGGQIGVDSQVGAGSTFWFMLPFEQAKA